MARITHAFEVGDIIVGTTPGSSFHILILDVLPQPSKYATMILETGHKSPSGWYPKKYFKKARRWK